MSTYTDPNGYLRYTRNNKLVHRDVAEKKLGRKLRKGEVVHHKDRNKQNNSPGNLWVFRSQAEHDRVHKLDALRYGRKASYRGFKRSARSKQSGGCLLTFMLLALAFLALARLV